MPQIREQIAMVHLPPSKTLKYLFHVRKTKKTPQKCGVFLCSCGFPAFSVFVFVAHFLQLLRLKHTENTQENRGKFRRRNYSALGIWLSR